ncbi:MAG TPA: ABC transporter permease [Candidatus Onthovicinus excrementipullorum]|nr:ABC transporter permease [Candidatus Onthovicinus excrementipullorum]
MNNQVFSSQTLEQLLQVLKDEFPLAIWETLYVTVISTALAIVIGLPLGVLLATGGKDGILPMPRGIIHVLGVIINLLRSVPFLILMIMAFPLARLIVGTSVGTVASIVPLVIASFPFVARLVEGSLREVDPNIIEAAQSMGATPFQIVVKVMIPESIPSLVSNFTIAITTILSYSAMSGIIGGGGLGKIAINYGYYRYQYLIMLVAVVFLVIFVQVFQSVGTHLSTRIDKRLKRKL